MQYENVSRAVFLDRPNRFVAHVERDGHAETVHVKKHRAESGTPCAWCRGLLECRLQSEPQDPL